MREIRALTDDELVAFAAIAMNAYPGADIASAEELAQRLRQGQADDPSVQAYGLFHDGMLYGGMRLFDFMMQVHTARTPVGGVGLVAVDLLHKKEHVAKEMIAWYVEHYRAQGATLAALYPFRPDFYRKMGFGYGTPLHRYRVKPASLPFGAGKGQVRLLTGDDIDAMRACYHRVAARTHGMMDRPLAVSRRILSNSANRVAAFEQNGEVRAYATFTFKRGATFIHNDIEVSELVYEDSNALRGLFAFFHTQADQINEIVFDLQDDTFFYLLADPRNGSGHLLPSVYHESSATGVGIMYRILNITGLFETLREHTFGDQTLTLRLRINDDFLPAWSSDSLIHFDRGRPQLLGDGSADVELALDVADASSLLMGCVDVATLYRYGMATISDPTLVPVVSQLFHVERKPICLTHF